MTLSVLALSGLVGTALAFIAMPRPTDADRPGYILGWGAAWLTMLATGIAMVLVSAGLL